MDFKHCPHTARRLYIGLVVMVAQWMAPFQTSPRLSTLQNTGIPFLKATGLALLVACPLSVVNIPCNSTPPRERWVNLLRQSQQSCTAAFTVLYLSKEGSYWACPLCVVPGTVFQHTVRTCASRHEALNLTVGAFSSVALICSSCRLLTEP